MIILHVRQTFKNAAQRDAFYSDLKAAGIPDASRAEKGNLQYEYFFAADKDNEMFLAEKWETEEDLAAHHETPHFKAIPAISEKYDRTTKIEKFVVED